MKTIVFFGKSAFWINLLFFLKMTLLILEMVFSLSSLSRMCIIITVLDVCDPHYPGYHYHHWADYHYTTVHFSLSPLQYQLLLSTISRLLLSIMSRLLLSVMSRLLVSTISRLLLSLLSSMCVITTVQKVRYHFSLSPRLKMCVNSTVQIIIIKIVQIAFNVKFHAFHSIVINCFDNCPVYALSPLILISIMRVMVFSITLIVSL